MQVRQEVGSVAEQVAQGETHCFWQVKVGLRM